MDPSAEIYEPVSLEEPNDDDMQNSEERPNKRRRKKSIVWEHFTIESAGPSRMKACCKHCKKSFAYINGPKLAGTSHLKRHISLGICSGGLPKSEATPNTSGTKPDAPKRRYRTNAAYAGVPFDQERCTRDLANMIIQHDYPLHIVEHPAFVDFVRTLHPQYNMVSFNTIQGECVQLYLREKQSLLEHMSEIPGRVNLTLDLATSNLSIGYAFLTGHFINSDWNLERRILNVIMLPFPDSDYAFNQAVISCISDWHLENKLLTITLDKSYANDTIMGNLRGLLPVKNSLLLNGQLLKGSCYARLLSQLAQDAMARVQGPINRIRESVKYVKTSDTHEEKFAELRQQLQVPSAKELVVDDLTKWNTTYQMLAAACELKEVFGCLDTADPVYKINPSVDDWKQVEGLCTFLKLFFEAASILTAPVYPPANAFYHEVSKIQLELSVAAMSQDPFVSTLTRPLKEKFDEYWRESFLVLAMAVVMDPRFKMKLVEFSFSKIFGENAGSWIKSVDDAIHELFLDYVAPPPANFMIQSNTHSNQSEPPEGAVLLPQMGGPSHGFSSVEDQSLQMHGSSHLSHSESPQEVVYVPEIGGPSEEFSSLEGQSQDMACEELQPEEKNPQDLYHQGFFPQEEVQHEAAYPKETVSQGLLSEEASQQDLLSEEMDTQEVPREEMDTQEVPPEEMDTQEVPDLEMQDQESFEENKAPAMPVEEMSKAVPSEELPQNAPCQEKIQPEEEQPSQMVHAQELVSEEMQPQELPSQELHSHEAPASDDTLLQDVIPMQETRPEGLLTKEVHLQGTPTEKMDTEEGPSKDVNMKELPADEELHAQEAEANNSPAQDSVSQGPQSEELASHGAPAQESVLNNVHTQDSVVQDAPAKDSVPQETPAQDFPPEKAPTQNELVEEAQGQDSIPEEAPTQDSIIEKEAQELAPQEASAPSQEPSPQVAPTQEPSNQVATPQELVPVQEAQELAPQEEAASCQEHSHQVAPLKKPSPQAAPSHEPSPQALPAQDPANQETPVQEPAPPEAPAQEASLQETAAQEPAPQEYIAQEPTPLEQPDQETVSQEKPAQESVHQEQPAQESIPQEACLHEIAAQEPAPQESTAQEAIHPEASLLETAAQEPAPQETTTQESTLEQKDEETLSQGQSAQEYVPQEQPAQESIPQEAQAQDLLPPEGPTQELLPPEGSAQELLPEEPPAQQLPPNVTSAEEMLLDGVTIEGMISHGVQTREMQIQETQSQEDLSVTQDMQHQVLPQGMQNQQVNPQDLLVLSGGNGFSDFEVYISAIAGNQHLKSELDQYLEETLLPRVQDFDVLGWWKLNKLKYPTLSRLAADILSIPVSTVGPESVFDTVSKKIDSYHGSLHPLTLEAIICAKDWLHGGSYSPSSQSDVPNSVMRLEY